MPLKRPSASSTDANPSPSSIATATTDAMPAKKTTPAPKPAVSTTDGYIIEGAIPWSDMGVRPQGGAVLGAALSVNDNDKPSIADQELMVSHIASRLWRDPTSWGTLTLLAP